MTFLFHYSRRYLRGIMVFLEKMIVGCGYDDHQMIEDGMLIHPYPDDWPWALVSSTIYEECRSLYYDRPIDEALVPLLMDSIVATQSALRLNPRCHRVELDDTIVGTVAILPNSQGGITITKASEG